VGRFPYRRLRHRPLVDRHAGQVGAQLCLQHELARPLAGLRHQRVPERLVILDRVHLPMHDGRALEQITDQLWSLEAG
jgi:hypothetical protein